MRHNLIYNLLISSAQVSTIRFSNARYKEQNNLDKCTDIGSVWELHAPSDELLPTTNQVQHPLQKQNIRFN